MIMSDSGPPRHPSFLAALLRFAPVALISATVTLIGVWITQKT
jgi:hypothetical protein